MMRNILGLVLVFMLTGPVWAGAVPDQPHVVVSGQSEVSVVPDILQISLNLTEVGQEVAVARDQVEKRSHQLIDTLIHQGVEKRDITAASLKITPHYNWNFCSKITISCETKSRFFDSPKPVIVNFVLENVIIKCYYIGAICMLTGADGLFYPAN